MAPTSVLVIFGVPSFLPLKYHVALASLTSSDHTNLILFVNIAAVHVFTVHVIKI